jgi:hypothetical protein
MDGRDFINSITNLGHRQLIERLGLNNAKGYQISQSQPLTQGQTARSNSNGRGGATAVVRLTCGGSSLE